MDAGVILATVLGSAGLFSLIQFLITRHDKKRENLTGVRRKLNEIIKTQDDMNLRVTRMELAGLIRNNPDNIDAILQVAEHYFIDLDGNAYAHAVFEKWATEKGVAIGWLPKFTKEGANHGKK